jgi:ParB family chromosome partitioning protein
VKEKKSPSVESTREPDLLALEQQFIDIFGTKVSLRGNFSRGSIQIEYFSRDDLDRILSLILHE